MHGRNRTKEVLRCLTLTYNIFLLRNSNGCAGSAEIPKREMVEVLRPHLERQGQRGGQNKLDTEDQLLVALEYWREYRSQFHIGTSWGLHETTVGRIVRKVEDLLINCGKVRKPVQASDVSAWMGVESDGG